VLLVLNLPALLMIGGFLLVPRHRADHCVYQDSEAAALGVLVAAVLLIDTMRNVLRRTVVEVLGPVGMLNSPAVDEPPGSPVRVVLQGGPFGALKVAEPDQNQYRSVTHDRCVRQGSTPDGLRAV
jgi:hypothetical protein